MGNQITGEMNLNGIRYHFGLGVAKDDSQAVKWFKRAVKQGNNAAISNLARCYANGWGVTKNDKKALRRIDRPEINFDKIIDKISPAV